MANIGIWGLFSGRGSGIGKMLAEHLVKSEHTVIGIGRDASKAGDIPGLTKKISIDIEKELITAEELKEKTGELDVLIVTAGTGFANPVWDIDLAKITEMAKANFILPAWIMSVGIHITKHIIISGSIAGVQPREGSSVYAGTKAGIIAFAESARRELTKHHIQTININNIFRVGPEKVMKTYEFMVGNPCNMDVTINI